MWILCVCSLSPMACLQRYNVEGLKLGGWEMEKHGNHVEPSSLEPGDDCQLKRCQIVLNNGWDFVFSGTFRYTWINGATIVSCNACTSYGNYLCVTWQNAKFTSIYTYYTFSSKKIYRNMCSAFVLYFSRQAVFK